MLIRGRKRMQQLMAEDRISALPDEILCLILSFLPTKFALTTTILSKRWTSLFHSLTSLSFDYDGHDQEALQRFVSIVDTIMLFPREQHQPIKELVFYNAVHVHDKWVEAAKRHRVESLGIYTDSKDTLSPNIFCCRTLVVLKLSNIKLLRDVSSVDLPLLKTLHLSTVKFQNEDDFKKLLYGAPILEDLLVIYTAKFPPPAWNKTLPKLVKLHFLPRVDPLSASQIAQLFQMEDHNIYGNISSPMFPNLIHMELYFTKFDGWHRVQQVLLHCPRLQHLAIKKKCLYYKYHEKLGYSESVSVPECVSSHLRTCFIGSILTFEDDLGFAAYIMKNARFLQAMTICLCKLRPKQGPRSLGKFLSLPRISPACKISLSNCRLDNTSECSASPLPGRSIFDL